MDKRDNDGSPVGKAIITVLVSGALCSAGAAPLVPSSTPCAVPGESVSVACVKEGKQLKQHHHAETHEEQTSGDVTIPLVGQAMVTATAAGSLAPNASVLLGGLEPLASERPRRLLAS